MFLGIEPVIEDDSEEFCLTYNGAEVVFTIPVSANAILELKIVDSITINAILFFICLPPY